MKVKRVKCWWKVRKGACGRILLKLMAPRDRGQKWLCTVHDPDGKQISAHTSWSRGGAKGICEMEGKRLAMQDYTRSGLAGLRLGDGIPQIRGRK